MFRKFLAILCKWILLLNELICNKHGLEDCNNEMSDMGKHITLETILGAVFLESVCPMISSDS